MFSVGDTYVSADIAKNFFVCDLAKCKSACCKDGTYGAPIDEEEIPILENLYETVKPYLPEENISYIKEKGLFEKDWNDQPCLAMVHGKQCVFAGFESNGNLFCAIERAWKDGKTAFRKPISCHLYPIRIRRHYAKERLVYSRWDICQPACHNGKALQVPLYEFVKTALVRKYGEEWYGKLVRLITGK